MAFSFWKDTARSDDDADAWFTPGRFAILLTLLVAATFPAVVAGDTFVYRDFGYVTIPFAKYVRDSFWRGEFPLWNPLNMCGLPFLGQWGTQPLYPPALLYVLLPLTWAVNIFCLAHLVLGGLGMHRLITFWTNDKFAASVAGVAYAFNAVFLNCATWTHAAAALAWMPWVVLATERCWQGGKRSLLVAAMVGAIQMLSGSPEIIFQTWAIIASLVVARCLRAVISKTAVPWPMALRLFTIIILVIALSAAQLLPFLDLLAHSQRSSSYGGSAWAMPSWGWANFLVPLFYSQPSGVGVYNQHGQYWICSHYLGIGAVALALFAVWKVRQPRAKFFGAVVLFSLLMALGENSPVYGWVRAVVPLGFMRYPIKFVITASFLVPVLAAFALAQFRRAPAVEQSTQAKGFALLTLVLLGSIGFILWYVAHAPMANNAWTVVMKSAVTRGAFLLLFASALFTLPRLRLPLQQNGLKLILIGLFWLDPITHAPNAFPVVDGSVFEPGVASRQFSAVPRLGESRVMLTAEANYIMYSRMISDPAKDFLVHRAGFFSNCNLLDDVPKVDGFNSLYPREIWETLAPIYIATNGSPPRLADFMGASQITKPGEIFVWQANPNYLPIITAGQKPVFADAETTLREIYRPEFDGRQVVYLPREVQSAVNVTNASPARILSTNFGTHRIEANVDATQPAIVVIAQSYYHWWQARVNDKPVPLLRANHGFQAVEVPAGQSKVELVYTDRGFQLGLIISLVSWLGCIGGWLFTRKPVHTAPEGVT